MLFLNHKKEIVDSKNEDVVMICKRDNKFLEELLEIEDGEDVIVKILNLCRKHQVVFKVNNMTINHVSVMRPGEDYKDLYLVYGEKKYRIFKIVPNRDRWLVEMVLGRPTTIDKCGGYIQSGFETFKAELEVYREDEFKKRDHTQEEV